MADYMDHIVAQLPQHPPTDQCDDMECSVCGVRDCPYGDPLHYHHDGCPACYQATQVATGKAGDGKPHVWLTRDTDGSTCKHIAICKEGAEQAHLLHHGMVSFNGDITSIELVRVTPNTDKTGVCFDPLCVLYALAFPYEDHKDG